MGSLFKNIQKYTSMCTDFILEVIFLGDLLWCFSKKAFINRQSLNKCSQKSNADNNYKTVLFLKFFEQYFSLLIEFVLLHREEHPTSSC